jgi:hypothetical protein
VVDVAAVEVSLCSPPRFGEGPGERSPTAWKWIDLGSSKDTRGCPGTFLRKEVIQPHLPIRLPCYDFVPLTGHTFGASPREVGPATSGAADSGDVTGGVYKARERIHRRLADRRLLAIPTSCRRVAACNPN